jgi:hypothetical protein
MDGEAPSRALDLDRLRLTHSGGRAGDSLDAQFCVARSPREHTHPRLKLVDESREAGGAWRTLASRGGPWRTLRRERRGSALVVPPRVLGSSSTARRAAGATRAA